MNDKKVTELLHNDSFVCWLFDAESSNEWENWKNQSEENKILADSLRDQLKQVCFEQPTYSSADKDRLKNRIHTSIHPKEQHKPHKLLTYIKWSAAAFLAGAVAFSAYIYSGKEVIIAANGSQVHAVLPDGSEVRLNSGSTIEYNSHTWRLSPSVKLDGEGYFYGSHATNFRVKTAAGIVTVLGTKFNVYNRSSCYKVECYQGKVAVDVGFSEGEKLLNPGQKILANASKKKLRLTSFDLKSQDPNWNRGEFTYENTPFSEVLSELERQFNINIPNKDRYKNLSYTGFFSNKDINIALKTTLAPMGFSYKVSNREIAITPIE